MIQASQATINRVLDALDDQPRTVRELHRRVDLCAPRTTAAVLRRLATEKRVLRESEQIGLGNIEFRWRYRRLPMIDGEKKTSAYKPRILARDDPGIPEPEFGASNRRMDEAFCAAMRREIQRARFADRAGVKTAPSPATQSL